MLRSPAIGADAPYATHVNPRWVRLLNLLEMNVRYERCLGAELFTHGWTSHSGFPLRVLRSQYRAQPSRHRRRAATGVGRLRPGYAAEPRTGVGGRTGAEAVRARGRTIDESLLLQFRQRGRGDSHQIFTRAHRQGRAVVCARGVPRPDVQRTFVDGRGLLARGLWPPASQYRGGAVRQPRGSSGKALYPAIRSFHGGAGAG